MSEERKSVWPWLVAVLIGLEFLADAYNAGVEIEALEDIAKSLKTKTWTHLRDQVTDALVKARNGA